MKIHHSLKLVTFSLFLNFTSSPVLAEDFSNRTIERHCTLSLNVFIDVKSKNTSVIDEQFEKGFQTAARVLERKHYFLLKKPIRVGSFFTTGTGIGDVSPKAPDYFVDLSFKTEVDEPQEKGNAVFLDYTDQFDLKNRKVLETRSNDLFNMKEMKKQIHLILKDVPECPLRLLK